MQLVIDNAPKIRLYLARVRGMHRLIGRVFNNAAAEAAVSDGGEARAQLEALTGLGLRDFFESVQVMTVEKIVIANPGFRSWWARGRRGIDCVERDRGGLCVCASCVHASRACERGSVGRGFGSVPGFRRVRAW